MSYLECPNCGCYCSSGNEGPNYHCTDRDCKCHRLGEYNNPMKRAAEKENERER